MNLLPNNSLGRALTLYSVFIFSFLFFCAVYFPVTDSDALAIYLPRFKLVEFGDLKSVTAVSVQYVFPATFEYIVWVISQTGYLAGLPSFVFLLLLIHLVFRIQTPEERFWTLVILMATPVVVTQAVSQKNDVALAAVFLSGAWAVLYTKGIARLLFASVSCALCIGIKWTGIPAAFLIFVVYLIMFIKDREFKDEKYYFMAVALLPILYVLASGPIYTLNYFQFGSPIPVLSDLGGVLVPSPAPPSTRVVDTLFTFYANAIDVLRFPILILSHITDVNIFDVISFSGSFWVFREPFYTSHSPIGVWLPVAFVLAVMTIFQRNADSKIRTLAIIGVAHFLVIVLFLPTGGGTVRYLLPSFVLMVVASAPTLAYRLKSSSLRWVALLIAIYVSASVCWMSNDRTLPQPFLPNKAPFTTYADDRDALMLVGLPGLISFRKEFKRHVHPSDFLLLIDNTVQDDINVAEIPHFLPFLLSRSAVNTRIVRLRDQKLGALTPYRYIMVFSRHARDPELSNFERIATTGFPAFNLYRRIDN